MPLGMIADPVLLTDFELYDDFYNAFPHNMTREHAERCGTRNSKSTLSAWVCCVSWCAEIEFWGAVCRHQLDADLISAQERFPFDIGALLAIDETVILLTLSLHPY